MSFEHNSVRKKLFRSACFCWYSGIFLREMDQKFHLVDSLVMETLLWTLYFVARKYSYSKCMQYYTMLLEQCKHIVVKDLATVI